MNTAAKAFTFLSVAASLTFAGCGNSGPATPIDAAQFEKLRESKENDGKRFRITGYPYLNTDVTVRGDQEIPVSLYTEPKGLGNYVGSVRLGYKDKENGMYIPDSFTPDDLKVFDKEGKQLGINDKITISFTMSLDTKQPPMAGMPELKADADGRMKKVEKAPQYYGDGPSDIEIEKAP